MADFSKLSPDAGTTILNCKDATARSQITDVYKVMDEMGAKNLLPNTGTTETKNTVVFTFNSDGSVNVDGQPNTYTDKRVHTFASKADFENHFKIGRTYKLSGCPTGGATPGYYLRLCTLSPFSVICTDFGNGATFTVQDLEVGNYAVYIGVDANIDVDNKTFYPMIQMVEDNSNDYQPHSLTNQEITSYLTPKVTNVKTAFKNLCDAVQGSTITGIGNAFIIEYGKLVMFVARLSKAANTAINMNVDISSIFPYDLVYDEVHPMLLSPNGGGSSVMSNEKILYLRYTTADSATYVDMTMIAFVI